MIASDREAHEPDWVSWSNEQTPGPPHEPTRCHPRGGLPVRTDSATLRRTDARQLLFRPHVWLSNEWFTPDGVPGIAVPFYLAHPRLAKLELDQMLEVEGGTPDWCMRILRHEAGHALENAYRLRRLRRRQQSLWALLRALSQILPPPAL